MTFNALSKTNLPLGTRPPGVPKGAALTAFNYLPIGDSITYGYVADTEDSYRYALYQKLVAAGLSPTFVGHLSYGQAPSNANSGVVGAKTSDHLSTGSIAIANKIGPGKIRADVISLYIGANDAADSTGMSAFQSSYAQLLAELHAAEPTARFVGCLIGDGGGIGSVRSANIAQINAWLPSLWDAAETSGLLIARADCRVLSANADHLRSEVTGGLHPNGNGYIKLSDALFPAVLNAAGRPAVW